MFTDRDEVEVMIVAPPPNKVPADKPGSVKLPVTLKVESIVEEACT